MRLFDEDFERGSWNSAEMGEVEDSFRDLVYIVKDIREILLVIKSLQVAFIEDILDPTAEYKEYKDLYCNLRDELECRLNNEDKERLEIVCCSIFDLEECMHKQSFVKGFSMCMNLVLQSKENEIADIVDTI